MVTEISELIEKDESSDLEFKESAASLYGIIKTVVAFANTAGGILVIGVEDRTKKVVGVKDALKEEERLVNSISDSIIPFLVPNIQIQSYRKKEVIIICIPHLAGPFYVKKEGPERGVYIRSGSTNRVADDEKLKEVRLFAKKLTFDGLPELHDKENILDWPVMKTVFASVGKELTPAKAHDLELEVTYHGGLVPSRGGVILFGVNRLRYFPDAIVRCVRFLGDNKARVLDSLDITSYPVFALDEACNFIKKNSFTRSEFGQIRRLDIPQFPEEAVREIVLNALMHADYAQTGSTIMIAVFDNRLEVSNPGGMPLGMTLERALAGSSRVRNRVIGRVFRELKITERWGSGLQRIIDSCQKAGLPAPEFKDFTFEFKVTIHSTQVREPELDVKQQKLVTQLKKKKKISTKEAAALLNIAPRNARVKLKKLTELGIVKRVATSLKDPLGNYVLTRDIGKKKT